MPTNSENVRLSGKTGSDWRTARTTLLRRRVTSNPLSRSIILRRVMWKRTGRAMLSTRFTKLVGCKIPIQQAGMGAASPPELVAAVSEAGALGMLGTARAGLNPATLGSLLERTRTLTNRAFGVNFILRPGSAAAQSPRQLVGHAAHH